MSDLPVQEITRLLEAVAQGDKTAEAALIPVVYEDLRRIASGYMRREAGAVTLQTTALVHEAYLRLARPNSLGWQNRTHFFAMAAKVMRQILVDHARARNSEKRGGHLILRPEPLDIPGVQLRDAEETLAVDMALARLAELDQRQAQIVEMRYFAGMTIEETAEALKLSPRTIKREWQLARAWLYGELSA